MLGLAIVIDSIGCKAPELETSLIISKNSTLLESSMKTRALVYPKNLHITTAIQMQAANRLLNEINLY